MKKILFFAMLIAFAPTLLAIDPCVDPASKKPVWNIPPYAADAGEYYQVQVETDCGICDTDGNPNASCLVDAGIQSTRTLDFVYNTTSGQSVELFRFEMLSHQNPGGTNDDIWDIRLAHPFLGTKVSLQTQEGQKWGWIAGACGGGAGAGYVVGAFITSWTGPGAFIGGGIGAGVGCLIGLAIPSGVAKIESDLLPIGKDIQGNLIPIGKIDVELDHDDDYEAQVDKFIFLVNSKALRKINVVYKYSLDEWKKVKGFEGVRSYSDVFQKIGHETEPAKIEEERQLGLALRNDLAEKAKTEASATAIDLKVPLTPVRHVLRVDLEKIPAEAKERFRQAFEQAGYSGDAVENIRQNSTIKVFKETVGATPTEVPWSRDNKNIKVSNLKVGDQLLIQIKIPKFNPGIVNFRVINIQIEDLKEN